MKSKLDLLVERLNEINDELSRENATNDMERYKKISKEHADITPIVDVYKEFKKQSQDLADAKEMLSDPEMKAFAQDEIDSGKEKIIELEEELQKLLLPKDPNDEKNIFLEIRAGTGGDESALFAGDILGCTTDLRKGCIGKLKLYHRMSQGLADLKKSLQKLLVTAPTQN